MSAVKILVSDTRPLCIQTSWQLIQEIGHYILRRAKLGICKHYFRGIKVTLGTRYEARACCLGPATCGEWRHTYMLFRCQTFRYRPLILKLTYMILPENYLSKIFYEICDSTLGSRAIPRHIPAFAVPPSAHTKRSRPVGIISAILSQMSYAYSFPAGTGSKTLLKQYDIRYYVLYLCV